MDNGRCNLRKRSYHMLTITKSSIAHTGKLRARTIYMIPYSSIVHRSPGSFGIFVRHDRFELARIAYLYRRNVRLSLCHRTMTQLTHQVLLERFLPQNPSLAAC